MQYIGELREGERLGEVYFCKSKNILKTKAGKSYYSLMLQDRTGSLDGKVWEITNGIEHFEAMDYIYVEGHITSFQGTLQANISRIRKCQEGEYDPEEYMPCTKKDKDAMFEELLGFVKSVKETNLRKLLESFFVEDAEFIKMFKGHSAAKSVHHGFIGGLLEHTLGVTRLCDYMAGAYPVLNRDLLIAAAIFHDIGKVREISAFPENDYTDDGQLLGHIYMGAEMIGERVREIDGFPVVLANQLKHCILSHHGELEYGSPKKPALAEAVALNFADNTDAKMQTLTEIFEKSGDAKGWLGFNRLFDSNIRKTDI
ncbi:MAG: HD domain-containing protein [Lachnospiraceae bacterium]|nr:HD domain-containing protein [Lachnospiraceae bacterium]